LKYEFEFLEVVGDEVKILEVYAIFEEDFGGREDFN